MLATYAKQIYMEHRAPGAPPESDLTYGLCTVSLFAVGNLLTALLVDRVGRRLPLLLGLVGIAISMGAFAATDEPQHAPTPRPSLAGLHLGTGTSLRARLAALGGARLSGGAAGPLGAPLERDGPWRRLAPTPPTPRPC